MVGAPENWFKFFFFFFFFLVALRVSVRRKILFRVVLAHIYFFSCMSDYGNVTNLYQGYNFCYLNNQM